MHAPGSVMCHTLPGATWTRMIAAHGCLRRTIDCDAWMTVTSMRGNSRSLHPPSQQPCWLWLRLLPLAFPDRECTAPALAMPAVSRAALSVTPLAGTVLISTRLISLAGGCRAFSSSQDARIVTHVPEHQGQVRGLFGSRRSRPASTPRPCMPRRSTFAEISPNSLNEQLQNLSCARTFMRELVKPWSGALLTALRSE
jgi:hypothetical protein